MAKIRFMRGSLVANTAIDCFINCTYEINRKITRKILSHLNMDIHVHACIFSQHGPIIIMIIYFIPTIVCVNIASY